MAAQPKATFTPEVLYGVGALALPAALIWRMIQYKTRNRTNDQVSDEAADALYDTPRDL